MYTYHKFDVVVECTILRVVRIGTTIRHAVSKKISEDITFADVAGGSSIVFFFLANFFEKIKHDPYEYLISRQSCLFVFV